MDKFNKKTSKQKAKGEKKNLGVIALVVATLLALFAFGWMYIQYQSAQSRIEELMSRGAQPQMSDAEVQEVLDSISRHMLIPEEEPSISTITNAADIIEKDQFFKDVIDGDTVVFFREARKAVIYSPSRDKIVNVGPIYFDEGTQQQTEDQEQPEKISIEIRNGGGIAGAASALADSLDQSLYTIAGVGDAANKGYTSKTIVNNTGKDIGALENQLQPAVTTELPPGEAPSSADVLIIIGL